MVSASNNNPAGVNQFKDCSKSNDAHVESLVWDYDHCNIVNKDLVSKMLLTEHGIQMSSRTVVCHRKSYGLLGSGATTCALPLPEKRQLVLDQLAKDPTSKQGPKTIGEGIVLTRAST
ncbi:hypothetical protein BYT27DRAFT_7251129 [Phlegmacium glaucopus]|nr:hypothetical protein BYT27DRAFT_7251129 [Phlegmacium glaucopus]